MNSLERIRAAINFQKTDRVPIFSHVYGFASKLRGVSLKDYLNSADLMAECQLEAWKKFGYDGVSAFADNCLEAEAIGCKISFSDNAYPHVEKYCLTKITECRHLCLPDPEADGRMPVVINACKTLTQEVGEQTAVIGTIQGPMTLAGQLLGMERLIYSIVDQPERFCELLNFTAEVNIVFGKALLKAGAHVIQIFDPSSSCSVINRTVFHKYILPHLKKIFTELKKTGSLVCWLNITGRIQPILDLLPETGADLYNIDYLVPISVAAQMLSDKCINGNIKPFNLISSREQDIEKEAQHLLSTMRLRGGFILSPGCEVPLETKIENIEAMIRTVKNEKQGSQIS